MKKFEEKYIVHAIVVTIIILAMSSCSTSRDMTMSKKMTQCAWFDCN